MFECITKYLFMCPLRSTKPRKYRVHRISIPNIDPGEVSKLQMH